MLAVASALGQLKWAWYHRHRGLLQRFQTFDAASRGPLGAVTLLYQFCCWHLASLGATVTLLALASDPFVQQTVTFPCRAYSNETASVPTAQDYAKTGIYLRNNIDDLEPSMKAAVYDGMMYLNVLNTGASISARCPSGNCEFPTYASVAVCSKCQDITSAIDNICVPLNKTRLPPEMGGSSSGPYNCTIQATLPGGLHLANGLAYALNNGYRYNFLNMTTSSTRARVTGIPFEDRSFADTTLMIANVSLLNRTILSSSDIYDLMLNNTLAFNCSLSFCLQAYTAKVTDGVFTEIPGEEMTVVADFVGDNRALHVPADRLSPGANSTFGLGQQFEVAVESSFQTTFNGSGTGNADTTDTEFSSDLLASLFYSGPDRIPETMRNLATSMTNNMRLQSSAVVLGTALDAQLYIHVRWVWLSLPLIMVIGSIVFLLLTVWQSRRWGIPSWRGSALATMAHGVYGGDVGEDTNDIMAANDARWVGKEKVSDLDRWAEDVEVDLRRRGRGGLSYGLVARNVPTVTSQTSLDSSERR
jgi:hypothetical protein